MITTELFFGLITYYFIMFMTPGPNNAMLAISGIKFGFKRSIPHMIGIPIGHTVQIITVCLGLGTLFQKFPEIQFVLKFVGCGYLFYLAFKMFGSFNFNFFKKLYHISINTAVTDKSNAINTSINFFIFLFVINTLIDEPKPAQVITEKKHINGAESETNKVAFIKFSPFGKKTVTTVKATSHAFGFKN